MNPNIFPHSQIFVTATCLMGDLSFPGQEGISRSTSDTPPTHYMLKLQLFSQLAKNEIDTYTSSEFEAGGYKWKLLLHPTGNKNKGITDHISLYLVMVEPKLLGPAWEIRVVFRLFLLDQNNDCYLTLQDTTRKGRRFHRMKLAWGFDKFLPLDAFNDAANGYLVNDSCVFGAEVYVCRENIAGRGECLSMVKDAIACKSTWRIEFSSLTQECEESKPFNAADHKWKIQLYPKGKGSGASGHLSLYLALAAPEDLPPASKIYAEYTIRILDQINLRHGSRTSSYWFSASNPISGWPIFISHGYFNQSAAGFLVKDICILEAEVKIHGVANAM